MIFHYKYKSLFWDEKTSKWKLLRKSSPPKDKDLCCVKRCKNIRRMAWKKTKTSGRMVYWPYCHKCESRQKTVNNPLRYQYTQLKHRAKVRNIEFTLTFQEFAIFCNENDYLNRQYAAKSLMTCIDRIDPTKGYSFDNIQMLTNAENVAKGNVERHQYPQPDIDEPF